VTPFDLILVEELGYVLPRGSSGVEEWLLAARPPDGEIGAPPPEAEPCDYLTPSGCSFPADLRPFGCAVDICVQMRRHQPPPWLAEAERRAERLRRAHHELLTELQGEALGVER
jgi:hypothetical protein